MLKINVIEDESYKIKVDVADKASESYGVSKKTTGGNDQKDVNISTNDQTMQMYYKYLVNMMINMKIRI